MDYSDDLYGFIKISRYAGMRGDYVQAAGGNTSVKVSGDEMLVKASGYQLTELGKDTGYACVRYNDIASYIKCKKDISGVESNEVLKKAHISGDRPSIETYLHALIPYKYVLHTHSVWAGVLLARKDGEKILKNMFPQSLFVGYSKPGAELAGNMCQMMTEKTDAKIIFLANHGVIVSGDSPDEVMEAHEWINDKIAEHLGTDIKRYKNVTYIYNTLAARNKDFNKVVYMVSDSACALWDNDNPPRLEVSPDSVVYCGKHLLSGERGELSLEDTVILYENQLYIIAENTRKAKEIESVLSYSILVNSLNRNQDMTYLSEDDINDLLGWEAEKYRRKRI